MAGGFPRGWTLNSVVIGAGGPASVTAPAAPAVTHVIDSIYARIVGTSPAVLHEPILQYGLGAGFLNLAVLLINASVFGADDVSLGGLDIAGFPGGAVSVQFSVASIASIVQVLVVQGHVI